MSAAGIAARPFQERNALLRLKCWQEMCSLTTLRHHILTAYNARRYKIHNDPFNTGQRNEEGLEWRRVDTLAPGYPAHCSKKTPDDQQRPKFKRSSYSAGESSGKTERKKTPSIQYSN